MKEESRRKDTRRRRNGLAKKRKTSRLEREKQKTARSKRKKRKTAQLKQEKMGLLAVMEQRGLMVRLRGERLQKMKEQRAKQRNPLLRKRSTTTNHHCPLLILLHHSLVGS
jgi:hypothetical protein